MDNTCNGENSNEICVNQLVNAKPVAKKICQSNPSTKIDVGFRFKNYTDPKDLFQSNVYKPFFGKKWYTTEWHKYKNITCLTHENSFIITF